MRADGDHFQDALMDLTDGARSVPRVFIGGRFVGGGEWHAHARCMPG